MTTTSREGMVQIFCTCDCFCSTMIEVPDTSGLQALGVAVRFGEIRCQDCRAGDHLLDPFSKRQPKPPQARPAPRGMRGLLRWLVGR